MYIHTCIEVHTGTHTDSHSQFSSVNISGGFCSESRIKKVKNVRAAHRDNNEPAGRRDEWIAKQNESLLMYMRAYVCVCEWQGIIILFIAAAVARILNNNVRARTELSAQVRIHTYTQHKKQSGARSNVTNLLD